MKKNIFFILLCGFFAKAQNVTYYVDATSGNDTLTGLTEELAWKSLSKVQSYSNSGDGFEPGDKILFKRGEVWENQTLDFRSSGSLEAPIVIGAYGTGHMPILSSVSELESQNLTWTDVGGGTWRSTEMINNPGRLFTDYDPVNDSSSNELLKAYDLNNLGSLTYSAVDQSELPIDKWYWSSNEGEDYKILYVHTGSGLDPNSLEIFKSTNISNKFNHITIIGQEYITIKDIEIQGGVKGLGINSKPYYNNDPYQPSGHIVVKNCIIGKYSSNGIVLIDSNDNIISDNIFDTNYTTKFGLTDEDRVAVSISREEIEGVDSRGVGDGVRIEGLGRNNVIKNNTFLNWVHVAVYLNAPEDSTLDSTDVISHNQVYNNHIMAPAVSYSRGLSIAGIDGRVHNNEMYNNLITNTKIQSQIAGNNNFFHHNIIDGVTQSDVRYGKANGIVIANNKELFGASGNKFDHNTILNCDGAGISINNWGPIGDPRNAVENNYFRNNILYNCGTKNEGIGLIIADNEHGVEPHVKNNVYYNNLIYSFNTLGTQIENVISYNMTTYTAGGGIYNIADFENNLIEGDVASGNIDSDPAFLDSTFLTGYHLSDYSPCYEEGKWITSQESSYLTDYYGNDFPSNSNPDIGHEENNPLWTYLIDQYCDATLSFESGLLECYEVSASPPETLGSVTVSYQFKFVDESDDSQSIYNTANATDGLPIHQMDLYARWWAKPKSTYNVEVKGFKSDGTSYSFGKVCQVTIPHLTHLKEEYCGILPVNDPENAFDGIIECYPILNATVYKFKFYDPLTGAVIRQVSSATPSLDMYGQLWVIPGTTYSVRVRAETANQSFSVGNACLVTVPTSQSRVVGNTKGSIKNDESLLDVLIYPNPTDYQLTIIGINNDNIKKINIYTLDGKCLKFSGILDNTVDVSNLSSGMYLLNINTNDGIIIKRFIKN